jgi:hypothetical protein
LEARNANENVLYQYLATILEPSDSGDGKDSSRRREPFPLEEFLLVRLLTLLSGASPTIRQLPSYANVLLYVVQAYGVQCYGNEDSRVLLKSCVEVYNGVLKQTLDDLVKDLGSRGKCAPSV